MGRLIDADALERSIRKTGSCEQCKNQCLSRVSISKWDMHCRAIAQAPTIEAEPVRHGMWMLKAHDERVNYRWNVTAECSECCNKKTEIWDGFFPGIPDWLAEGAALLNAKQVKLSNYCPHCGAKMDGGAE